MTTDRIAELRWLSANGVYEPKRQDLTELLDALKAVTAERDAAVVANRAEFEGHKLTILDERARWWKMRQAVSDLIVHPGERKIVLSAIDRIAGGDTAT